jgi:hypothetical protein
MDERAIRNQRRAVGLRELLHRGRRREEIRKEEDAEREAEARPEQTAEEEDQ